MTQHTSVMISSTARDLPDHRKEVMDACLRQSMFPLMMEHLPASADDAVRVSLEMVDQADVYLGVFAHRYGYVPAGYDKSITEMEYDRAREQGKRRIISIMHDDHPVRVSDIERGENALKLEAFKERLKSEQVINFYKSPEDLRGQVINSLSKIRERDLTNFHRTSEIPAPPEPFIAHPYTLLQTAELIGRRAELQHLTDWVADPRADVYQARVLNIVAIGGMGKSALTWKWFNDLAPREIKPLVGRMWWSFYESDASFENFITRALSYVTGRAREEIDKIPSSEREEQLLAVLDRRPFLIVMDGLERILMAYARMDAARLADDDLDTRTANIVAGQLGLPEGVSQSFTGQHRLRKTADPRAGAFLRRLARTTASRILVSTRLYPADLQATTGQTVPGSGAYFLKGLSEDDVLKLWRAAGVTGERETLMPLFQSFDKHPLLVQALASEVAHYRRAPGDFDRWRLEHPGFDPFRLPLVQVKTHVLEFALRGLDDAARKVLHTVAAFRMPAAYDTLTALLVGEGKRLPDENMLDRALTQLEDRGLLGWDKRANRYDLHPIVRGVAWSTLAESDKQGIFETLHEHFAAFPSVLYRRGVKSLEDLTAEIELFNTLIGMKRYDDAFYLFYERLSGATLYRLSANRQLAELLELLFPDGTDQMPRLSQPDLQAHTLNALAMACGASGEPGRAAQLLRRMIAIKEVQDQSGTNRTGLGNLSRALQLIGELYDSEAAARRALVIDRQRAEQTGLMRSQQCDSTPGVNYVYNGWEGTSLQWLGWVLAARGLTREAEAALKRALTIFEAQGQPEGVSNFFLAQLALWTRDYAAAHTLAENAWELAHLANYEGDFIRAARMQGGAALGLGQLTAAEERLQHALARSRAVNHIEEEIQILVALAEVRRQQGDPQAARELLDDLWQSAERGPYPLFHADACNVLAQIERDAGDHAAAKQAATKAYRLAWCDGPPFAYHWALETATEHLAALGAQQPSDLAPYDEAAHEPMVKVEIGAPVNYG